MVKRRLIWHLISSYLIVIILAITAIALFMAFSMKKLYLTETSNDLRARSILFEDQLKITGLEPAAVDSLCKKLGKDSATRFTVILPSGKVIGDTDDDPAKMENHANRPEIKEALASRTGISIRYSYTLYETMMYVALPMAQNARVAGVVRAAFPITTIDKAFGQLYPRIIFGGIIIALLSGILSFYLSRRISVPLEKMKQVATEFSKGEFGHRLPSGNSVEIDELAAALNSMASELDDKLRAVVNQRNELDAILSSMAEGVLTFDTNERLLAFNLAASGMLRLDTQSSRGRYVQEIIRHKELQQLVARLLENREPYEGEIEIDGGQILGMHGTILEDNKGECLGVLVVLNDITRLRHLEKVRRDFVANVSHELRTPITSIRGFVETLRDGAIENPNDAKRFLGIIADQTDRLNTIIEDLLILSKIEESEKGEVRFEEHPIKPVLQSAITVCGAKAQAKKVIINLICNDQMRGEINPDLLEQAIINLLDNALKYSNNGGNVKISVVEAKSEIVISIQDWGIGIEKRHLPRLFERFYVVDKARSRELGGTGLGLAIVRHIVLAHHGNVSVESVPGKGSTFTIHLPC